MDRILVVEQDGATLAQITFTYQTPVNAVVRIQVFEIIEIKPGIKTTIPLYLKIVDLEQQPMDSIAAIEAFDRNFLVEQVEQAIGIQDLQFIYPQVYYRYAVGEQTVDGIVDIEANFSADNKVMHLTSAVDIGLDKSAGGSSVETNIAFIKRILGNTGVNLVGTR